MICPLVGPPLWHYVSTKNNQTIFTVELLYVGGSFLFRSAKMTYPVFRNEKLSTSVLVNSVNNGVISKTKCMGLDDTLYYRYSRYNKFV